jgi:cytochrome P450
MMGEASVFTRHLFTRHALLNSEDIYRSMRETGPVVRLRHGAKLYAAVRFEAARQILRAPDVFSSRYGVAVNDFVNGRGRDLTLTSDGDTHQRRRSVLMRPLSPTALTAIAGQIEELADQVVRDLAVRQRFCAVRDFAMVLPVEIVATLVGLSAQGRQRMLDWAAATFNALGPRNLRMMMAMPSLISMGRFMAALRPADVSAGGWAGQIFDAEANKEISPAEARGMIVDYVAPSLDTTILAAAEMFWRLANDREAFEALRADPDLATSAVNETVRLASPIRGFSRLCLSETDVEGVTIPEGARVIVMFASANRDEHHYAIPERFDIRRNPRDHLGWGNGPHSCAGMHLARLELEALARALARHATRLEVGRPSRIVNNTLQGFRSLPAEIAA